MAILFTERRLRDFARAPLATACADAAVFADLRGTTTHGVMYIVPRTLDSIRQGKTTPGAAAAIARHRGAAALLCGNGLVGPALGRQAMLLAITNAREYGVGAVATRNGNPLGMLGYYSALALPEGLIGLAMTNTAPAVAPHGSGGTVFGPNPISFAVPAGREPAILFDAATSVVAAGKLRQTRRRGEPLPVDWVMTPLARRSPNHGRPTRARCCPSAATRGRPSSAWSTCLPASWLAPPSAARRRTIIPTRIGAASRPPSWRSTRTSSAHARFAELVDRRIQAIHAAPPLRGVAAVLAPGECGWREAERRQQEGITLADEDWSALLGAMREAGLPADELVARHGPHISA
ncbi:MAG: Ldh family oxidoreductase [Chloroflexi bacterium]|nr:Ldh family oxidoreductase [Chloroflexota bacterium]